MNGVGGDADPPEPDVDVVDVGPRGAPRAAFGVAGGARRRWPWWWPVFIAAIVAALVLVLLVRPRRTPSASPTTTHPAGPSRVATSAPGTSPAPSAPAAPAAPITVTALGHPLLGVTAGWELFARGGGVVVRLQLGRGRITRTTVPDLRSSGPVSFIVGPKLSMVRPIDYVPGYVVPDGQPARQISASLSQGQGGPVFPGPDPNHVWTESLNSNPPAMTLTPLDSAGAGVAIPIPTDSSPLSAVPDGAGYLLFPATGGVYDARPDGLHRITTGALLAVGPTGWLTLDCDARAHCVTVYTDRASNVHRALGPGRSGNAQPGAISPDGRTAAIFTAGPGSTAALYLLDLTTGATHRLALPLDQAQDGTIVWSPDGKWLFAVDAAGKLTALNARTRQTTTLIPDGIPLPRLSQLAIRIATTN